MNAGNLDPAAPDQPVVGYESRPVTKPPNWHGLVTLDMVLNNLSTGLFLVAAVGELMDPVAFRPLAPLVYPLVLLFLLGDLVSLVFDLGDPLRFHHMLRVWKPSSPMSLGTWVLSAYAVPVTLLAIGSLLPFGFGSDALDLLRRVLLAVGAVFAAGAAAYKGVLFSTTAQRGWEEARWMGGYLINSALCLGAVELLLLATLTGHGTGMMDALRLAARLLLALNLIALVFLAKDVSGPLAAARGPDGIASLALVAIGAGVLVPFLLVGAPGPAGVAAGLGLMLVGAVAVRAAIVQLPHRLADGPTGGRADGRSGARE
jgi:Ni/Fe-hydrogenase subunit HybB-like protein